MAHAAPEIFKAYDIRGIVGRTLTEDTAYLIGRAVAARAAAQGIGSIAVGRDGRLSGAALSAALCRGLTDSGIAVTDTGTVATPMLYFAALTECGGSGIMITGSHNPPEYNGFKIMLGGDTLAGEDIRQLRDLIENEAFTDGSGSIRHLDIAAAYQTAITSHITLARPMKIAVDAGNGVAGAYAGNLYRALGCDVQELFCDVDGHFPNHHPDPAKPEASSTPTASSCCSPATSSAATRRPKSSTTSNPPACSPPGYGGTAANPSWKKPATASSKPP